MKSICIIPAFNEDKKILQKLINDTDEYVDKIVVINDGSKEKLRLINCMLVHNNINFGKGYSIKKGISYARNNKFDIVIFLDADYEHDPKCIPQFLKYFNKNNGLVIGKRKSYKTIKSNILNKWGNLWVKQIIKKNIDFSSGYRAIDMNSLKKLSLLSNGFEFDLEMILESYRFGININTIDISSKTASRKSHVKFKSWLEINNFFDKWILSNKEQLQVKKHILFFTYLGYIVGRLLLIFF
jgi:hypothetical protein